MLDYDQIMPIVKRVAASVSSKFPPYVQTDDTAGQLLLWIYQNRAQVERAVEDGEGWQAKIASTLRKVAFDHCNSEKAASEGYDPDSIYKYSADRVKAILPLAFDRKGWQQYDSWDETVTQNRKEKFSYEEIVDVKNAIDELPDETKKLLFLRFGRSYTVEEAAAELFLNVDAAKKRSTRAVVALQKVVGYKDTSYETYARRRTVKSNAASRAELSGMYEG